MKLNVCDFRFKLDVGFSPVARCKSLDWLHCHLRGFMMREKAMTSLTTTTTDERTFQCLHILREEAICQWRSTLKATAYHNFPVQRVTPMHQSNHRQLRTRLSRIRANQYFSIVPINVRLKRFRRFPAHHQSMHRKFRYRSYRSSADCNWQKLRSNITIAHVGSLVPQSSFAADTHLLEVYYYVWKWT